MSEGIVNKVASSGLITIDLADWYKQETVLDFDLKPILWNEMALREKDLRQHLKEFDFLPFSGAYAHVFCSQDIILPQWAYLLISAAFEGNCKSVIWNADKQLVSQVLLQKIAALDITTYQDAKIVIKGCSEFTLLPEVYIALVAKLKPVVASIMYGEPCSTVPVYKRPKQA